MNPAAAWARRRRGRAAGSVAAVLVVLAATRAAGAPDEATANPYLGQPAAIEAGDQIYRSRCIVCHMKAGGRGPNLFQTKLTDEQFLETVLNGREGTMMPAFGQMMSPDEVWKVHAFVKSRPRF